MQDAKVSKRRFWTEASICAVSLLLLSFFAIYCTLTSTKEHYSNLLDEIVAELDIALNLSRGSDALQQELVVFRGKIKDLQMEIHALKQQAKLLMEELNRIKEQIRAKEAELAKLSDINSALKSVATLLGVNTFMFGGTSSCVMIKTEDKTKEIEVAEAYVRASVGEIINTSVVGQTFGRIIPKVLYKCVLAEGCNFKGPIPSIIGKSHTITLIRSDKRWAIAGYLKQPWTGSGAFINDSDAFLLSVNRLQNCSIAPGKSAHAARLNSADKLLEFGDGDLVIYKNGTGISVANHAYACGESYTTRRRTRKDPQEFYADERVFKVESITVLQVDEWISSQR